ncbi:hypothetical protein BDC45DRAFT_540170 [Circinella umbellata]|nr:hypothetical protein BDC45DRAFT_540170 [Circinella umbellata]
MLNRQQQQESIICEKINTTADFNSSQFEQNVLIDTLRQSQPDLRQVPEWAQFIVHQQTAMAKTIAEQTKELKVQDGKLQLLQKRIKENEVLKAQVTDHKKKLQHLESQQQQQTTITPEDVTNNDSHDQDLLLTGTCKFRHAISTKEWEHCKTEIEATKKQQQQ